MHPGDVPPSYGAVLRIPSMGRILLGMVVSRVAASMLGVALVLFTLGRFGSPELAGLVTFVSVTPGLLVGPVAGALLDRHGRARLIILDQAVAFGSLITIAVLAIAGALTPLLLILITAVAGLTHPLSNVGLRTLFPLIVPRRLWERVNALDSNGYVVATLVGPPAAGILVETIGGSEALIAIAALYALAAVVIVGVKDPPGSTSAEGRILRNAWDGLRYTVENKTLLGIGVGLAVLNVAGGIVSIVLPVILLSNLHLGDAVVGGVWAVMGVTGGIGALAAGRWRISGKEQPILVWGMVGYAASGLFVLASPTLAMILLTVALQGFVNGPMDVAMFTLRQRRTDPAWLGRAFAVSMSLNFLGYPVGAAVGGQLVAMGSAIAVGTAIGVSALAAVLSWWLIPKDAPTFDA
jgi:MFS family permease